MRERLNGCLAPLAPLLVIAAVLAGTYYLSRPIAQEGTEPEPIQLAPARIELPAPEPPSTPEVTEETPLHIYDASVPLSQELQQVLHEACDEAGVPVALALGVIEVESGFQVDAVSQKGCVGLIQLNPRYFQADLTPADNLREGIAYLGQLLVRYGDTAAALTVYNAGSDTGSREYANAVLEAAERWAAG